MKKIFLMLLMGFLFAGCEKDDICTDTTPTTPRLVIEFYDNNEATPTLKKVYNLGVIDPDFTEGIGFTNVSKIQVPLNPGSNITSTTLKFIQNGTDAITTNDNIDILTFNYSTENIYVSRACGFKTLFNLNQTNPIVQTEPSVADGAWIKNITIVKYNLENENEIHVKIKF
jgi:hypothetical protein